MNKGGFEKTIFPELQSRFNYVCEFSTLTSEEKESYIIDKLNEMIANYNEVFKKELPQISNITEVEIDVNKFENMRNLNSEIRKLLIERIENN